MSRVAANGVDSNMVRQAQIGGEVKLSSKPWYHGRITREKAENLLHLMSDGLFLVRESTNYPGDYTLCVCFESKVEHYRILTSNFQVTIDEEEYFDSLQELVNHYQNDKDGLCVELRKPLSKVGDQPTYVNPKAFQEAGWVIPAKDLKMGESLGKGEFADVHQAEYKGELVAVKTLKEDGPAAQALLEEASVMTSLQHINLVSLRGICISNGRLCLVTEYMSQGSLVEYLRSRGRQQITKKSLFFFSKDVCSGMAYLESRKFVHRDLAARNVLLNDDCVAKVADFGLARDQNHYDKLGGKLPIKWSAPETLNKGKLSSRSDVWSFGVLLWELYSYGRVPYPRIQLDQVQKLVEQGYRMEMPEGCPIKIFAIMKDCWMFNPESRPTFAALLTRLKVLQASGIDS